MIDNNNKTNLKRGNPCTVAVVENIRISHLKDRKQKHAISHLKVSIIKANQGKCKPCETPLL